MEELNEQIKILMKEIGIWKDFYTIEFNTKTSGQSLTFFIKENENKLYIAKYFDYFQGIKDYIIDGTEINANTVEEFENKLADTSTNVNIEEILECIYISKRCFNRYVEVCSKTIGLFPKLFGFKNNVKIGRRFYGLLIEEFVKGKSLKEVVSTINRKEIDIYEYAINFVINMADTIKKYTDCGFVHRDISPDNIIIAEDKPVVIDPGFIKIIDRNSTRAGCMFGKLYYASPEQFAGNAVDVDFSSDLYSIGIILFEIITGINLLYQYIEIEKKGNPHQEILKNLDRDIEDMFFEYDEKESEKNKLFFRILKKMLQIDKKLRFNDINTFMEAISLLEGGKK